MAKMSKAQAIEDAKDQLGKSVVYRTQDHNLVLAKIKGVSVVSSKDFPSRGYISDWVEIYDLYIPSTQDFVLAVEDDWYAVNPGAPFKDCPKWVRNLQYWLGELSGDDAPAWRNKLTIYGSNPISWLYRKVIGKFNVRYGYHPYWPF